MEVIFVFLFAGSIVALFMGVTASVIEVGEKLLAKVKSNK